jgi:hypothetical protein
MSDSAKLLGAVWDSSDFDLADFDLEDFGFALDAHGVLVTVDVANVLGALDARGILKAQPRQ